MSKLKQKLLHSVGLIVSIVFIYLIFKDSKIIDVVHTIYSTSLLYAIIVASLSLLLIVFKTYRWKLILDKSGVIPFNDLLRINFTAHMFNIFLPLRAGEVFQVFITESKTNIRKSDVAASLVLNKFLELLSLLILFYSLFIFVDTPVLTTWLKPIKYLVIFSIAFLVIFSFKIIDVNRIKEPSNKILRSIQRFFVSLTHIGNKTLLLKSLALSILVWGIELLMIYILLLSFGIHAPVWAPILLIVGINLAILIPATSGSFGPYEFSIMLVLGLFSVPKETAVAFAITLHFLEIIFVLLAGLICYVGIKDKIPLKKEGK